MTDTNLPGLAERIAALPLDQTHSTWPTVALRVSETERELIVTALRAASAPDGVVVWQWRHTDPISGNPIWNDRQFWNGHRSDERRPLYAAPQSFTSGHIAGQREAIARIIDPHAFNAWEGLYEFSKKNDDEAFARRCADHFHKADCDAALAKADAIIASLPVSAGEIHESDGGRAIIEGGAVVIRFPLDAMQTAMDGAWSLRALDTRYKITDINEFSKEFARALNREDEQGTTEIHKMADRAFIDCIENGAFGIEEHEQQDI